MTNRLDIFNPAFDLDKEVFDLDEDIQPKNSIWICEIMQNSATEVMILCKVHIFLEGHNILRNLHLTFIQCSASQK